MENETTIHQPSPVAVEEEVEIEIPVFHQEIVEEILSRLPVKSLCRFRCVSKHWLSLILDPRLAKSHFQKTITNASLNSKRKRVIVNCADNVYSLEYETIGRNDENFVALELHHNPIKKRPLITCGAHLLGSCNGLVCISPAPYCYTLFNPSTRESKIIPDSPSGLGQLDLYFHGFGYANNDYKLVKVGSGPFRVLVYSLRADSWSFVSLSPFDVGLCGSWSLQNGPGSLLNGVFHWMARVKDEKSRWRWVVAAFSLDDEVVSYIHAPDGVVFGTEFVVGVLNSRLCLFHRHGRKMHDHFWMMTDYGVVESWTKIKLGFRYRSMRSLCFAQNGEDLLLVNGKLLLYNFEDGNYKYLVVDGIPERNSFEVDIYFETLVSPNAAIGLGN